MMRIGHLIGNAAADLVLIREAAAVIRGGGLVAFPTETVYGLGAHALDALSVQKIYAVKGRPSRNPIIVHIASAADLQRLVAPGSIAAAQPYIDRFWPGPLTIILPKSDIVPSIVTGGGATVAIRMPSHPVALSLIREAGVPIAAPSANRSGELSPTLSDHVRSSLGEAVDYLLDGGSTQAGIESTVLDLSGDWPVIRRPGPISRSELGIEYIDDTVRAVDTQSPLLSPGMLARHYAPRTPLMIISVDQVSSITEGSAGDGEKIGIVYYSDAVSSSQNDANMIRLSADPREYASALYAALHDLDVRGLDRIFVERPPASAAWEAVNDRLGRAGVGEG